MKKSLLLISIISIFFSCKEDTTPTWLEIPSIDLVTNEIIEGADSQNITDAWVYMDGTPIGAFELPCRIPILAEGEHKFLIYAGIKNNGINATRTKYPFYERFDTTLNLVKGATISFSPIVYYKSDIFFELTEDFEDVGISLIPVLISDTPLVFIDKSTYPTIVEYGNYCGGVFLTQADSLFKVSTQSFFDLPKNEDVYLEIDYMNSNSIGTGVIAQNSGGINEHTPLIIMNAQESTSMVWKKIYIELTEDVSFETNAASYEIYLISILDPENTTGVIYLDNIKIIRYQ